MGFDSNGTYTRWEGPDTWKKDAASNTKILADRHDSHDKDLADALSDCLNRSGRGGALANIPMGGHKITNLLSGTALTDAATVDQVRNIEGWKTSKYIEGADLDGRLNFTGLSGVNGITWTYADLSWVARKGKTGEGMDRLVMNSTKAPPTTSTIGPGTAGDVFFIDESGRINSNVGQLLQNLSYDGSNWRTISASSYGGLINYVGGDFELQSNDAASGVNAYSVVTPRKYLSAKNEQGSSVLNLFGSASGKTMSLRGNMGSELRWLMYLGDGAAESGSRKGSNFQLFAYDNTGANPQLAFKIDRELGVATLNGDVVIAGKLTNDLYESSTTALVVATKPAGIIRFRTNGSGSLTDEIYFNAGGIVLQSATGSLATNGIWAGYGIRSKIGMTGAYGDEFMNFNWTGSNLVAYANNASLGNVTVSCDYRIKKDIAPLPSVWNLVKAVKPISYTQRAYEVWTEDDTVRWGFVAHELQEALGDHAASGTKDGPDVQGPNIMGILAAVTRALQEAMQRIEQLESAA